MTECLGFGIFNCYVKYITYIRFTHIFPIRCMWQFENLAKSYFPISLSLMGILMGGAHVVLVTFPHVIESNFARNSIQWGQMEFMAIFDLILKSLWCVEKGCEILIWFEQLRWQMNPRTFLYQYYQIILYCRPNMIWIMRYIKNMI